MSDLIHCLFWGRIFSDDPFQERKIFLLIRYIRRKQKNT